MIKLLFPTIVLLLFSGCFSDFTKARPPKISDVKLDFDQNGSVGTLKTYEDNSTKRTVNTEVLKTPTPNKKYEKIPNFNNSKFTTSTKKEKQNKKTPILISGDTTAQISLENIPLNEFIDVVFSQLLKLNYTLSADVRAMKTPITLNMLQPEPKQQVLDVVQKLLQMNGVAIEKENNILFLSKKIGKSTLTDTGMYIGFGTSLPNMLNKEEVIGMFIPLRYTDRGKIQDLIRAVGMKRMQLLLISKDVMFTTATVSKMQKLFEVIKMLDRATMVNKQSSLIYLDYLESKEFVSKVKNILQLNAIPIAESITDQGIILDPIDTLNAVLVITPEHAWLKTVLFWKEKLDIPEEMGSEPRLYIYDVRSRRADDLSDAIKNIIGLTTQKNQKSVSKKRALTGDDEEIKTTQKVEPGLSTQAIISRVNYVPSVSADLPTNTLMLRLTPEHYKILLPIIKKLDELPLQVLIEITLAEVTMVDQFQFGFEWFLSNGEGLSIGTLDGLGLGGSGFSGALIKDSGNLIAKINAASEDKLLDIVSQPRFVILNNETGKINVGQQVPIITSESTASDLAPNSVMRNVSYRNTGIIVGVTPTINSQGILTMVLDIALSEAQTNDTSSIDSPLIVDRSLTTSVVLRSNETVLLGGLISKNKSSTINGVPILQDIPFLGYLFQTESEKTVKTELIMLIKPVIIRTPQEYSAQTERFNTIMQHINRF
ncbi:MAG: hypothetical protein U9R50_01440 [Campylobacterota bacterium]|nr:hypothetical protein [Campylobacterota bacterium]